MKNLMLLINMVFEYFVELAERFTHKKQKPTLLALAMLEFNKESWLDGIIRQRRLTDYLYHGKGNSK